MANPSKAKGTGGETELLRALLGRGVLGVRRTSPGKLWDLERPAEDANDYINALATRPDRGQWLVTLSLDDFCALVRYDDTASGERGIPLSGLRVEVKRYARFALHRIFESKFGGKKRG